MAKHWHCGRMRDVMEWAAGRERTYRLCERHVSLARIARRVRKVLDWGHCLKGVDVPVTNLKGLVSVSSSDMVAVGLRVVGEWRVGWWVVTEKDTG